MVAEGSRDSADPVRIGLAFGLATLSLGVVDFLWITVGIDWTTDVGPEAFRFTPRMLVALPLMVGALALLVASVIGRGAASRARSLVIDLVCALPLLACIPALFSGASIAASKLRWPMMLATLLVAFAGVALLRRLCLYALARLPERETARQAVGAAALAVLVAGAVAPAYASATVLRGLYPTFHGALALLALGTCAAALLVVLAANAERGAAPARVSGPRRAALALGVGLALWLGTVTLCARAATGRNALTEHAPFASTIVPAMFAIDGAASAASSPQIVPPIQAGVPLSHASFDPTRPKPHIVLITIDALRGDVMREGSRYAPCAPKLRALAKRHIELTHAYAPSNATIYALPGLLTGLARAGAETPRAFYLPVMLGEHGYESHAWVTTHDITLIDNDLTRLRKLGFHFGTYKSTYFSAKEVTAWALDHLRREQPQLVWIHLSDVHAPYALPPGPAVPGCTGPDEYARRLATLDQDLDAFIAALNARDDVVWAFTSDHGESLGERRIYGHASNLFDEQIRVPLILGGAGVGTGSFDMPVTALDLPATLIEMAGATLPPDAPRLHWRAAARSAPMRPAISFGDNGCAVTRDQLKLLVNHREGTLLLFDLASDPAQERNVAAQHAAATKELFSLLAPPHCTESVARMSWLLPR